MSRKTANEIDDKIIAIWIESENSETEIIRRTEEFLEKSGLGPAVVNWGDHFTYPGGSNNLPAVGTGNRCYLCGHSHYGGKWMHGDLVWQSFLWAFLRDWVSSIQESSFPLSMIL